MPKDRAPYIIQLTEKTACFIWKPIEFDESTLHSRRINDWRIPTILSIFIGYDKAITYVTKLLNNFLRMQPEMGRSRFGCLSRARDASPRAPYAERGGRDETCTRESLRSSQARSHSVCSSTFFPASFLPLSRRELSTPRIYAAKATCFWSLQHTVRREHSLLMRFTLFFRKTERLSKAFLENQMLKILELDNFGPNFLWLIIWIIIPT